MDKQIRDKFLTEQLGECWHELETHDVYSVEFRGWYEYSRCSKCKVDSRDLTPATDFSTWEGFGKLWKFCQKQEWWPDFHSISNQMLFGRLLCQINPDKFAYAAYKFLKQRKYNEGA